MYKYFFVIVFWSLKILANEDFKIIIIEEEQNKKQSVLKQKAKRIEFPLSDEDKKIISFMKGWLFKAGGVGLAATQINVSKQIALIYIPESAVLLRDGVEVQDMHAIINPEYRPAKTSKLVSDFEGCYSVKTVYGKVPRHDVIELSYQDEEGTQIQKQVSGFYARVLQHEIDHLNGLLITDRLTPDCVQGSFQEMLEIRRKELPEHKRKHFDELLKAKGVALENEESN